MNIEDLKILGLSPNATADDVEKKYDILLLEQRSLEREGKISDEEKESFKLITDAYDRLMGRVITSKNVKKDKYEQGKWFTGFNKESFHNFFYLYKWQFWGSIIGILMVTSLIYSMITVDVPDFSIVYMGDVFVVQDNLSSYISKEIPEIKQISYTDTQLAGIDTFIARFVTADLDFVFIQESMFREYAKEGYFLNLDDIVKENKIDHKYTQDYRAVVKNTNEEHIYGIEASHLKILKDKMKANGIVIAIPHNTKNKELARKLIDVLY